MQSYPQYGMPQQMAQMPQHPQHMHMPQMPMMPSSQQMPKHMQMPMMAPSQQMALHSHQQPQPFTPSPYGMPIPQNQMMQMPQLMQAPWPVPCIAKDNEWVTLPAPFDAQVLGWVRGKGYNRKIYLGQIANINQEKKTMLVKLNDKLAPICVNCWFEKAKTPSRKVQKYVEDQNKNDLIVVLYSERCKLKQEVTDLTKTVEELTEQLEKCGVTVGEDVEESDHEDDPEEVVEELDGEEDVDPEVLNKQLEYWLKQMTSMKKKKKSLTKLSKRHRNHYH